MNQSAIIGGALLAGFAMFLASRDRLSVYSRVLWGDKPAAGTATPEKEADSALGGFGFDIPSPGDLLGDLESYIDRELWGIS